MVIVEMAPSDGDATSAIRVFKWSFVTMPIKQGLKKKFWNIH